MGNYRDHRQPRSHGFDSYQSAEDSEPSYFQRRPLTQSPTTSGDTVSTPVHDAELLWFHTEKGFGFVRLSDGSDAFLHGSKLQAAGHSNLPEGARLTLRTEIGHKGPQVVEVLSVSVATPALPTREPAIKSDPQEQESVGVVKRYDAVKGFGFITVQDGDVFVHATALARSGLTALDAGQNVAIRYGRGPKGLEVRSIQLR